MKTLDQAGYTRLSEGDSWSLVPGGTYYVARGGSAVIRQHPEDLVLLEVDALELTDVDTPQALAALSESAGTNR